MKNKKSITLDDLLPMNLEEEKKKFFFDPLYNPQFVYKKPFPKTSLSKYGSVSDEYLDIAKNILSIVIKKWGTESGYMNFIEGKILSREEFSKRVTAYLVENHIENKVKVEYSKSFIAPASISGYILRFRLPISIGEFRLIPTLHHEVGTHIFRRINDSFQPWHKHRQKYKLLDYLETEEGIATIHSHFSITQSKLVWRPALFYYIVYQSQRMSFVELNQDLKQYVDDRERRWNMCVRAKRGVIDTSIPETNTKDQVYLRGLMKVLRWLKKNDFDLHPLYLGKIAVEDLDVATHVSADFHPMLPNFLEDHHKNETYKKAVLELVQENKLKL